MYSGYNMTQHTPPMETSVLIPTNNMSRHVNKIVETSSESVFDEFKPHRGVSSYQPKMFIVLIYDYISL